MHIIKPGAVRVFQPAAESAWRGRCKTCGCEFACTGADVTSHENSDCWVKMMGHYVFYSTCPQADENGCALSGATEVFPAELDDPPEATPAA